jgi:hypothetical protein
MKLAQYRMLGRIVRGERLTLARFKDIGTIAALHRKWLIGNGMFDAVQHGGHLPPVSHHSHRTSHWFATDLGRRRHAEQKPSRHAEAA